MRSILWCAEAAWLATVQSTHHHEVNAMFECSQLRSEIFPPQMCEDSLVFRIWIGVHSTRIQLRTNRCAECATNTHDFGGEQRCLYLLSRMTAMMHNIKWLMNDDDDDDGDGVDRTIFHSQAYIAHTPMRNRTLVDTRAHKRERCVYEMVLHRFTHCAAF